MTTRRLRILIALLVLDLAILAVVSTALPAIGAWLVVADRLQPSDAIFVLEGHTPARELEAAALYHRKLAPVVGLSHARDPQALARRLAHEPAIQERAAAVLRAVGVPETAILRLQPEVRNTAEELAVIAAASGARGFHRVIIVTSPSHTRRVRVIWDRRHRAQLAALVTPTTYEAFDAARWWRSRGGIELALHEIIGMVNFRLGTVLPSYDDGE